MDKITLMEAPSRGEMFSVVGRDFTEDAVLEFQIGRHHWRVQPSLVRPTWLVIDEIPPWLPVGPVAIRVVNGGRPSKWIATRVHERGGAWTRVLSPGKGRDAYTIAFVANPTLRLKSGRLVRDPVTAQPMAFALAVLSCLRSYLMLREDLFRRGGLESLIRFVVVFEPLWIPTLSTTLVSESSGGMADSHRERAAGYLATLGIHADVIVAIHGSTDALYPTSQGTDDDFSRTTYDYEYDGDTKSHGLWPDIPGATALSAHFHDAPTPLHEFAHAASEWYVGWLIDEYHDLGGPNFWINKKKRAMAGSPLPPVFCTYRGTEYLVDQTRGSVGYPSTWRSYLPEPTTAGQLNLMDDYRLESVPADCVFDRLTKEWLFDRLWAKANR